MTFADLLAFLRSRGMDRLAFLFEKYETSAEVDGLKTLLPAMGAKLAAKGLWTRPTPVIHPEMAAFGITPEMAQAGQAAVDADLSPVEAAVLPLLRELDAALSSGGALAAMDTFNAQIKDTANRNAYLAVLAA